MFNVQTFLPKNHILFTGDGILFPNIINITSTSSSHQHQHQHQPQLQHQHLICRSWYPVQEDAATAAESFLLHRAFLSGRVDLHDNCIPRRLPHHVPSRQVASNHQNFKQG